MSSIFNLFRSSSASDFSLPYARKTADWNIVLWLLVPAWLLFWLWTNPPHGFDLAFEHQFYVNNAWPLHADGRIEFWLHFMPKVISGVLFACVLGALTYLHQCRRAAVILGDHEDAAHCNLILSRLYYAVGAALLCVGLLWWLKQSTGVSCPWSVTEFGGSAAVVETVPLRLPAGDSLHPDAQLLEKIRFFGADDKTESAAALLDRLAAGDVPSEDELPAGSRAELLAWLLALQTDDGDSAMFSTFFARRSERIREDIDAFLSAEEGKYVKLLTSVRELYKSRALRIEQNGFYVISTNRQFDPFASTELSATATDARVVLLTSGSGAPEVSQADMPVLKNVERRGAKALDGLDPEHAYDVGVVLTTDGGVPALLYRRSGGESVVRELSAAQYVDILVSGGRPLINVDTLPAPAQELSGSECKILPLN